jgi:AraC-like DNA-binding protein
MCALRYATLVSEELRKLVSAQAGRFLSIEHLDDLPGLLSALKAEFCTGIILDPACIRPDDVEIIARCLAISKKRNRSPNPLVVCVMPNADAMKAIVALAQNTRAQFVFAVDHLKVKRIERAILVPPSIELGAALAVALECQIQRLDQILGDSIRKMIVTGLGPIKAGSFAIAQGLERRTLERALGRASLSSARLLVSAGRIVHAYTALTLTTTPFSRIARRLGFKTQRAMDSHLKALLGCSSAVLRARPLSYADAAERMAVQLTQRPRARVPKYAASFGRSDKNSARREARTQLEQV